MAWVGGSCGKARRTGGLGGQSETPSRSGGSPRHAPGAWHAPGVLSESQGCATRCGLLSPCRTAPPSSSRHAPRHGPCRVTGRAGSRAEPGHGPCRGTCRAGPRRFHTTHTSCSAGAFESATARLNGESVSQPRSPRSAHASTPPNRSRVVTTSPLRDVACVSESASRISRLHPRRPPLASPTHPRVFESRRAGPGRAGPGRAGPGRHQAQAAWVVAVVWSRW